MPISDMQKVLYGTTEVTTQFQVILSYSAYLKNDSRRTWVAYMCLVLVKQYCGWYQYNK